MVYTTYLWWFGGWFIIVLPTLTSFVFGKSLAVCVCLLLEHNLPLPSRGSHKFDVSKSHCPMNKNILGYTSLISWLTEIIPNIILVDILCIYIYNDIETLHGWVINPREFVSYSFIRSHQVSCWISRKSHKIFPLHYSLAKSPILDYFCI